jgi:hypothetical protein
MSRSSKHFEVNGDAFGISYEDSTYAITCDIEDEDRCASDPLYWKPNTYRLSKSETATTLLIESIAQYGPMLISPSTQSFALIV